MIKQYLILIKGYPRFLLYSSLHIFFSSPGQSFAFAIFVPSFTAAFGLGAGGFGALYSAATLIAAGLLPLFGPLMDRFNLRLCSAVVGLLMLLSLVTASFAHSIPMLFVGVLILRFSGQGLMAQIGGVSTSRFFNKQRGKALAIVGFGLSAGVIVFPITLAILIQHAGWQNTLRLEALSVAIIFIPCSLLLLRKTDSFLYPPRQVPEEESRDDTSFTRKEVLRERFFYFAIPYALLIPFFSTGLMIHLGSIAAYKGWSLNWVASCFVASAIFSRVGSFITGPLVDRFSARKLFPFGLIPYVGALSVLMLNTHPFAAPFWLGLSGLSVGCTNVAVSALWAEVFGTRSLGAIASMVGSLGVFATAVSPVLFGWLIDSGVNIDHLLLSGIILTLLVILLGFAAPAPSRNRNLSEQ